MRTCSHFRLPMLLLSGGLVLGLVAQEKPSTPQSAMEDELMALLNTPVTVAGKKAQKISEAPAIISVITAEDLEHMGVTNLYDALSTLPGINLTETFYGFTSVGVRGNLQAHYNNKVLVLINNHPAYDTVVGSFYLEQIPLNMVKRIEVLRGPGSTLYGTNAFTGVIKIITKTPDEMGKGSVALRAGDYKFQGIEAAGGFGAGGFKMAAGGSYSGMNGYPFKVVKDENGRAGTLDYFNNVTNGFVTMEAAGAVVNLGYWQQFRQKFGVIPTLVSTGERVHKGFFADGYRSWDLSKTLSLSVLGYLDNLSKYEEIDWYPPAWAAQQAGTGGPQYQDFRGSKYGGDVQLAWTPTERFRVTAGGFFEHQESKPYYWKNAFTHQPDPSTSAYMTAKSSSDKGGYLQVDGRIHATLGAVLGVRVNNNSVYGTKTTPSAGLVFNPTASLAFKLLYGQAFRSPNFFEKYVATVNVVFGDEKLEPEKVSSLELGMDWFITPSNSLRVNVYSTSSDELIARTGIIPAGQQGNTKPTPKYANSSGQKIQGLEAENRGALGRGLSYFVNASFLKGTEKLNDSDILFLPKVLANAGLTSRLGEAWSLSAYLQYVGKTEGFLADAGRTPASTDAYELVHLNLEYRPTRSVMMSLAVRNAFDKTWAYPEYVRRIVPTVPGGPDRFIHAKIAYTF